MIIHWLGWDKPSIVGTSKTESQVPLHCSNPGSIAQNEREGFPLQMDCSRNCSNLGGRAQNERQGCLKQTNGSSFCSSTEDNVWNESARFVFYLYGSCYFMNPAFVVLFVSLTATHETNEEAFLYIYIVRNIVRIPRAMLLTIEKAVTYIYLDSSRYCSNQAGNVRDERESFRLHLPGSNPVGHRSWQTRGSSSTSALKSRRLSWASTSSSLMEKGSLLETSDCYLCILHTEYFLSVKRCNWW